MRSDKVTKHDNAVIAVCKRYAIWSIWTVFKIPNPDAHKSHAAIFIDKHITNEFNINWYRFYQLS